jgi:hypothetical protein
MGDPPWAGAGQRVRHGDAALDDHGGVGVLTGKHPSIDTLAGEASHPTPLHTRTPTGAPEEGPVVTNGYPVDTCRSSTTDIV